MLHSVFKLHLHNLDSFLAPSARCRWNARHAAAAAIFRSSLALSSVQAQHASLYAQGAHEMPCRWAVWGWGGGGAATAGWSAFWGLMRAWGLQLRRAGQDESRRDRTRRERDLEDTEDVFRRAAVEVCLGWVVWGSI
jgi:hypothetical protein